MPVLIAVGASWGEGPLALEGWVLTRLGAQDGVLSGGRLTAWASQSKRCK